MYCSFRKEGDAAPTYRASEKSAIISTNDPCVHAASLRDWSQDYLQLSAGHFSGEIVETSIGPIQVFKETIHQSVDEKANPRRDSYTVGVPIYVEENGYWQGHHLQRDSLMTLRPNEELYFRTPPVSSILVTVINCNAFDLFSSNTSNIDIGNLITWAKTGGLPPQAAKRFRITLQQVLASVISTPEVLEHAASERAIIETVMNASLEALTARAAENKPPRSVHAVQRAIVERARQYVLANRETPPTVSDLCLYLKMSRRGLHHAFMNVLGVNIVTFLRYVRLHGVKKDLLQASSMDSVTGIACKWGFWHMGMFSSYYKSLFGETPSTTLRKLSPQSMRL
ncbi:MAG: helix-turn-helix domain-containing protein [Proteobacteria bacterium]|nr:helix-turn-helix domain-containing protein [Pseudomonadota bacterium]